MPGRAILRGKIQENYVSRILSDIVVGPHSREVSYNELAPPETALAR
jgi:hypothetical protein